MRGLPLVLALVFFAACTTASPGPEPKTKRDGGSSPDFATSPNSGCGAQGQGCCSGQICDTGLQCNTKSGGCCTASGNTCTDAASCCAGLSCTSGKCCSAIAVACKSSADCCTGLTCSGGVCDKPAGNCGDVGKACCMPNSTCSSGNTCVANVCKACGAPGQACCTGGSCSTGNMCTNNVCEALCGGSNQPCCKGATPCKSANLMCDTSANKCVATGGVTMGGLNQLCKPGNICDGALQCIANKCQMPPTCNSAGVACCSGSTCTGGFTCNTSTNKCEMASSMCTAIQSLCDQTAQCCQGLQCTSTVQPEGDPAKSCCVGVGKACPDGDFDCCGWLVCNNGKCTAGPDGDPCLTAEDCVSQNCGADGFCASTASMCGGLKSLGYSCDADTECCNGASCEPLGGNLFDKACCLAPGDTCDGSTYCCGRMSCSASSNGVCVCRKATETCLADGECCGTLLCRNGSCEDTMGATVSPGGACTADGECIQANSTSYTCNGDLGGGTMSCCTATLQTGCTSSAECCGTLSCDYNNGFSIGGKKCCAVVGDTCSVPSDCCGGAECTGGVCVP